MKGLFLNDFKIFFTIYVVSSSLESSGKLEAVKLFFFLKICYCILTTIKK